MPDVFDRLYARSPFWLQNLGVSLYGYVWQNRRFGGNFRKYVSGFEGREAFTPEDWQAYQTLRLRELLAYAAENVPYYRKTCPDEFGSDFGGFELEHLARLPVLEKEHIRLDQDAFIAENIPGRKLFVYHTSGTTGTPLAIKFTSDMHRNWSAAYEVRVRRWAGVNYKMSRAMIGGRLVVPKGETRGPFWRYNIAERQLYLSAFHISPMNTRRYVEALNRYRPDYLVGYASSHFFLARMIKELGLQVIEPKAVLTSSEKLTPEMRTTLETVYKCPVFDAYSGVEACCLASECEYHRLHVSPDVGIIELLDERGDPIKHGESGEIVATGLLNFVQPLIRYRTGDLAVWSDEPCPCGREMPILDELVGRLEDTVVGPDGRETVRFHGIFVGLPHVIEGQVIQETLTRFRLRLVVEQDFNDRDRHVIYKRFQERLGAIELEIELVNQIERTERGKFRAVISKVKRSAAPSNP
jgi:phenylacetate-CoA ligase